MIFPRKAGSIKRAITLLVMPAVVAASVLSAAPAQAAAPTSVAAVSTVSVRQAALAPQVLPAVVLVVLGRCALGSMSSLAIDELYTLIVRGQTASAEDRIQSAVIGCLSGGLLPLPVRWAVQAAGTRVAAGLLVVAIRLRQICIPRCL